MVSSFFHPFIPHPPSSLRPAFVRPRPRRRFLAHHGVRGVYSNQRRLPAFNRIGFTTSAFAISIIFLIQIEAAVAGGQTNNRQAYPLVDGRNKIEGKFPRHWYL